MLSNQEILESRFRDLDLRVMALQVRRIGFGFLRNKSMNFLQSQLEHLPNQMASAVNEQNNRLWQRLESHVQNQLSNIRTTLPTISVTGPQRQNTV